MQAKEFASEHLRVVVTPTIKQWLLDRADEEKRSVGNFVRKVLEERMQKEEAEN